MDLGGIRRLYLPLRPKAKFSPGRKTPPSVSAPSTGLRPLIVSHVKCGGGPCRGHSVLPCAGNTICLQGALMKELRKFDIGLPETRSGATGPSLFKVGDNQRPERTMSGVENLRLSVPSPVKNCPGEVGGINCGGGHGSPPVLSEVPHELSTDAHSKECKRSPQQFIPAGFTPSRQPPTGDGILSQSPSPHRT